MKSNKGVTLISLVLYVLAVTVIVGTVATITSFFYTNTESISESSKALGEYNKFNLEMLREVKQEGNSVVSISDDQTRIMFNSGNTFTFQDGGIYKNKVKICTGITNCKFRKEMQEEKQIVVVLFEMKDFVRTIEYVVTETRQTIQTNYD